MPLCLDGIEETVISISKKYEPTSLIFIIITLITSLIEIMLNEAKTRSR